MCLTHVSRLFTHLLSILFFDRLEVGPQVHGDFVLGAQQRAKDGIGRHTDPPQIGPLKFPPQVQHLDVQIFNLHKGQITYEHSLRNCAIKCI